MTRLVLFDIDGTLLSARGAPRRAFGRALVEVYGMAGPVTTHPFDGKTDPQIARELLALGGISDAAVDDGLPELWRVYARELHDELSAPGHETLVLPGVHALLSALDGLDGQVVLGLLTGNIERGATLKLESAGIGTAFRVGAYGSDRERRDALPQLAVERARALTGRTFRAREIVVVGDTPHDVTCGRALDVHTVAVATGRHDRDALSAAGAHHAFDDLSDTAAVLDALFGAS